MQACGYIVLPSPASLPVLQARLPPLPAMQPCGFQLGPKLLTSRTSHCISACIPSTKHTAHVKSPVLSVPLLLLFVEVPMSHGNGILQHQCVFDNSVWCLCVCANANHQACEAAVKGTVH
jgi:hypothetical protein